MSVCARCGTDNPRAAKFCLECGAGLVLPSGPNPVTRRLVTILFADVVGSTALGERLDAEAVRAILRRYFAAARSATERHGGTVEKFIGDAVMAVFGVPRLHEDDALRAARAALDVRAEIDRLNVQLRKERGAALEFRIGLNSGHVVVGGEGSETLVTGGPVNVAARLEQAAAPGEILIGEQTYQLLRHLAEVEPVEPVAAKGKSERIRAFRLLAVVSGRKPAALGRRSPFVGREAELRELTQLFARVRADRRPSMVVMAGPPGIGKSRLVDEFAALVGEMASVVRGRCLPYGEGITWWPMAEIVRAVASIEDADDVGTARRKIRESTEGMDDRERVSEVVASTIGLADNVTPRAEIFWAFQKFLVTAATPRPLVCVVDDVHWAEPTLIDALEYISRPSAQAPLLVTCTARPEFLEVHPSWSDPNGPARTILLEPLDAEAVRRLARQVEGGDQVSAAVIERVVDSAEGNPLFAEEVLHTLLEATAGDRSAVQIAMPTSLLAVIAARIDRLPAEERAVAQRMSIVGRSFDTDAALALIDDQPPSVTTEHLRALTRRDVLEMEQPAPANSDRYRFGHALIRDAAYDALAKADRAELHERFGRWVESTARDRATEQAEIVGHHYEQAVGYRRELGLDDERTAELAAAAGEQLLGAGWRAYQRGDPEAAIKLLARTVGLLPAGADRRWARVALALSANAADRYELARAAADELESDATSAGDAPSMWKARLVRESVRMWSDSVASGGSSRILPLVASAVAVFEKAGDDHGLAIAYDARAELAIEQSKAGDWQAASRRVIEHAVKAGDRELEEKHRGWLVAAALWGRTPVPEVLRLADEELARNRSRPAIAELLQHRALAHAMNCDAEPARADVVEAGRIRSEIFGPDRAHVYTAGRVEQALGDLEAAEAAYKTTVAVFKKIGETGGRSTILGDLGLVAFELGRPDGELAALAEECRLLASDSDVVSQALWREVLALVAARAGEHDRAERLIGEAASLMEGTDDLVSRGSIACDHGRVRVFAQDYPAARMQFKRAIELFEAKGDAADMRRVRHLLGAV